MPLVSVIIPCYNSAAFLEPCVESVRKQTLADLEILLVDDGSTDETRALAERLAAADSRITVLAQPHSGPGDARNRGMDAASAPYVTFVDSDDQLPADACEALRNSAPSEVDIVIGGTQGRPGRLPSGSPEREIAALYTGRMSMAVYAKLYRRAFLLKHQIRFPAHVFIEDRNFLLQCLLAGARLAWVHQAVYHRRLRPDSAMHQVGLKHVTDTTAVYQLDTALLERHGILDTLGRHAAWATLVVDAYVARAISADDSALREVFGRELQYQEMLFRSLPAGWRTRRLVAAAARLRRAIARGGSLRFVRAELALLKALL